jgi:hypothetical protein
MINNMLLKAVVLCPVIMGLSSAAFSQSQQKINIVTTAVPFLRISPDARAGAMGETGVVSSPDVSSQYYNVSKYAFATENSGIGLNYTPWLKKLGLQDVYLASLAGYYKLDETQTISGSVRYFSLGNIQLTDNNGNDLYEERPRETSLDFGYSRKLSDRLALGVALRYINSNLVGRSADGSGSYKPGNAVAGDIGLYYTTQSEKSDGWSFGAALSNLGSKIGYTSNADEKSFLPANLGLGAGYTWVTNDVHKLSVNGEINKLLVPAPPADATEEQYKEYNKKGVVDGLVSSFGNKAMAYSAGGEYTYDEQFVLRAGYYTDSRNLGKRSYFTTGFGINYSVFGLNFSYLVPTGNGANVNPLANTMRFSLVIHPGSGK